MTIASRSAGVRAEPLMGTLVRVQVVGHDETAGRRAAREAGISSAIDWFREVETACSRFDEDSELSRLCATVDRAVHVSPLLYRAIEFAIAVAEDTDGAFDPTVGASMQARGFDRHYRTADRLTPFDPASPAATFRDVQLDPASQTIALVRPLLLDLGGVAKGLAIDLAVEALRDFRSFAIDAGGDVFLGGRGPAGDLWSVGIRHPRLPDALFGTVRVSDRAVCTSGDYERVAPAGHHLLDPRTGRAASTLASATVIAPSAMLADALATAAFVLGPDGGLALFERHGVEGLLVTPALERHQTTGMPW